MTTTYWPIMILVVIMKTAIVNSVQSNIVEPESVVQAEGLEAVFECLYPGAVAYGWALNGTLQEFYPSGVRTISPSAESRTAMLIMLATPQYNNTVVQCQPFGPLSEAWVSENVTLTILNSGISDIMLKDNYTISWSSLIPRMTAYFLDIRQVGSIEYIASVKVNATTYVIPSIGSNVCDIFTVTVTPTDGRNKATHSTSVTGYFPNRKDDVSITCYQTDITEQRECNIRLGSPLKGCSCVLTFIGADSPQLVPTKYTAIINGTGDTEYIKLVNILPNRNYLVNVDIDINGHIIPQPLHSITTHDIVEASVYQCSIPGALNTSCQFVNNTTARGYLAVVTNMTTCQAMFFVVYNIQGTNDTLEGVGKGSYSISFFDLEHNRLPTRSELESGYLYIGAASVRNLTIQNGEVQEHPYTETNFPMRGVYQVQVNTAQNTVCFGVHFLPMKYLVLVSNCYYPDLLVSLVVSNSTETCIKLEIGRYTAAFFRVNSSEYNTTILDKNPEQQVLYIVNSSDIAEFSTVSFSGASKTNMITEDIHITPQITNNGVSIAVTIAGCCVLLLSLLGTVIGIAAYLLKKNMVQYEPKGQKIDEIESPMGELQCTEQNTPWMEGTPEPMYAIVESKELAKENGKEVQTDTTQSTCVEVTGRENEPQIYAQVELELSQVKHLNTDDVLEVEYALIDHEKLVEIPSEKPKLDKQDPPEIPQHPTILSTDTLHALLTPAAGKWYEIGLAMGFDKDTLEDEIYAGNSTDWLRLGEVCGLFCNKTERPSWEEVVRILWKVEEWEIADKVCRQEKLQVESPMETMEPPPSLPPKSVKKLED